MFDVGFWELALIGVIALLVVGPDRLPGMARTVGFWVGRTRRYVDQVKRDVERELHADELRQAMKGQGLEELKEVVDETRDTVRGIESDFDAATEPRKPDAADQPEDARVAGPAADAEPEAPWTDGIAAPVDAPGADPRPDAGAAAPADPSPDGGPRVDERRETNA